MAERKLSELIREGAKLRPQCREQYYVAHGSQLDSCSFGAAAEALCGTPDYRSIAQLHHEYKAVLESSATCFCGDKDFDDVGCLIIHLNDDHKLTREAIADHIASLGY